MGLLYPPSLSSMADMCIIDPHTWSHCDILKENINDHQQQERATTTKTTTTTARIWFVGLS